jgi:hypothetical protein
MTRNFLVLLFGIRPNGDTTKFVHGLNENGPAIRCLLKPASVN